LLYALLKQMWVHGPENRMQCTSTTLSYSPYNCIAILRADVMHISGLPWRDA
jgi:hypothetical protein